MIKCSAPNHALMIKFNGSVVPDGQFKGEFGNIYRQTLDEMWNNPSWRNIRENFSGGSFPPQCQACAIKESTLGHSRRQFFVDLLDPHLSADVDTSGPNIYFLDIHASNKCNLKCLMCNGRTSTAWIKDEIALSKLPSARLREDPNKSKYVNQDPNKLLSNLFADKRHFRNLRYVSLKGGEPFMDPTNLEIIKYLKHNYDISSMTIDLTTNGTVDTTQWWPVLDGFGKIKIHVSLEATGDMYQFIRGGYHTLQSVIDNVKSWPDTNGLEIIWVYLLMAYNIFEPSKLIDLYLQERKENWSFNLKNIVINPNYLSPYIININTRKEAAAYLTDYLSYESSHLYGIKHIHNALLNNNEFDANIKRDFLNFTYDLVKVRNNKELINGKLERILREVETSLEGIKTS